jgi:hypothetical protein
MHQKTKFTEHPVVSTVLWILGHDLKQREQQQQQQQQQQMGIDHHRTSSTNILSWRDDHGGHLEEFYGMQDKHTKEGDVPVELRRPRNETDALSASFQKLGVNNPNGHQGDISPQSPWGFYVAITPPQQDYYSKESALQQFMSMQQNGNRPPQKSN